ncbi:MAG: ligase-associated DNA damage response DEXH box helicase [Chitinophagaceae bacterium]|nr:ligase-associated DNA damage response DEXH box helicase [Oligoflexus sp.]
MPPRSKADLIPVWSVSEMRRKLVDWMKARSWKPLPHQLAMWDSMDRGESGLLQMPTGAGKTYAAFFGLLPHLGTGENGLLLLYITPLRALTRDLEKSIRLPCDELNLPILIETRTGDTKASVRAKQRKRLPHILLTTPESLALLLSYSDATQLFKHLKAVVVDEWHELMGSKRGSLLELNLARLRRFNPKLQSWALSATIHNAEEAAETIVGQNITPRLITGERNRKISIRTLLPDGDDNLPWAGHLGLRMLPKVLAELDPKESSLLFTNTRSQAERWYEALLLSRPDWSDILAIHHGSIELKERERVENGVKTGTIRFVVCTASLDLGVDFPEVDKVYQIGSPKQIARLMQRAGRSAHAPGKTSQLVFVPTHALELLEIVAAKEAVGQAQIEARSPLKKPLDVLAQHIVSSALAAGFYPDELYAEVTSAYSYRTLSRDEFDWALAFVRDGSGTLKAYPQYCKIVLDGKRYVVTDRKIEIRHRQNLGTIVSDASMLVKLGRGKTLGTIDESFLAKMKKGESFLFSGRWLELIAIRDLTAYVRLAKKTYGHVSVWSGTSLPWSPILSSRLRDLAGFIADGHEFESQTIPELKALQPIIDAQKHISAWPHTDATLIEFVQSREGTHIFFYPFDGRQTHEGLGLLITTRLNRMKPMTCVVAVNDYGLEIVCSKPIEPRDIDWMSLLCLEGWQADVEGGLNTGELEKRQFRAIARIAGLVLQNVPGAAKSTRQIQTSSSLLYDVFARFDPTNLLLKQARNEVLEGHFDKERLERALKRIRDGRKEVKMLEIFSPLGFPLFLERTSVKLSSESSGERIEQAKLEWQKAFQQKYGAKPLPSTGEKPSTGTRKKR